ncbi:MAG TPA: hypothetical protein VM533_03245 [Fimbriiglobus sp.]|nr:hypothetical protein [Fimbriiglobus sp.]
MLTTTRHTRSICVADSLARATFTDILPAGDDWVGEVVALREEFKTLVRLESRRFEALKADLSNWRERVTCGEVEFDPAREDDFKGALRALISLEDFLLEKVVVYQDKGLSIAQPWLARVIQSHRQEAQNILESWKSPEWETADERTVKWDKEQTRHLRERLGTCK